MAGSLTVNLSERSYTILLGASLITEIHAAVGELRAAGRRVVVLTDKTVAEQQSGALAAMFGDAPQCVLTAGETSKSIASFGTVLEFLAAQQLDRGGVLFTVGGGVIGDLGGFAAAAYLRGIEFYQVPTTLLAMVDSSVGGKTGINLIAGKNLAGAFYQPRGVFIATDMLGTLPAREFAAGMAEVIKYGLLGDAALFAQLEQTPLTLHSRELAEVIRSCCAIKARIVEADERELAQDGGRALLNLGHTFGHAIEQVAGYGHYLHGEAIAIGLAAAARLSEKLGFIAAGEVSRIEGVLAAHALPVRLHQPLSLPALMAAMARDKKVRAGLPRFVVLKKIGAAATHEGVTAALAETCFREVGAVD
ncbi:MAG: 3-dehydroquinate synthase [Opitutaceae bacterium]|nr:3-dehydroquinate synthase [Opitutaceae bacterium]MBP9911954.1 3-dehydroquinate synthase [Opitutaceae bacterium]